VPRGLDYHVDIGRHYYYGALRHQLTGEAKRRWAKRIDPLGNASVEVYLQWGKARLPGSVAKNRGKRDEATGEGGWGGGRGDGRTIRECTIRAIIASARMDATQRIRKASCAHAAQKLEVFAM